MALGIQISSGNGEGGDFTPIVKYDARAGRAFRIDRFKSDAGFENNPVDITRTFKAVIDMENIEVGFMEFGAGAAPVFAVVRMGEPLPPKPTPGSRQGVRLTMMLARECGGDNPLRELAGNSAAFLRGVDALHDAYLQGKESNAGKLPVVTLKDTIGIKSTGKDKDGKPQVTTNYQPVFEIASWVARPEKLVWTPKNGGPAKTTEAPASTHSTAPSTGSTKAAAPQPAAAAPEAKQPEMADADDFG